MRKKMITIALAGMMAFSLAACGAGGNATTKGPEVTTAISKDTATEEIVSTEDAAENTSEKAEEGKKPEASKPAVDQKDEDSKDADQDTLVKNTVSKKEETGTTTKKPATTTEKPSTTTEKPASTTTKKPASTTTKKPASTTTKKPASTTNKKPSTATDKKKPAKPATKPSDTKKAVKISTLLKAVQKAYGDDYVPNMDVDQATLAEKYGVKKSWYTEAAAQVSMISMHVDTFIAVKAKPGKADEVEKALNAYRDSLIADTLQYPMNKARIPGSRVDRIGDYVFFTLLGKVDSSVEDKGEEAILAATKKECKIAYTTISKLLK